MCFAEKYGKHHPQVINLSTGKPCGDISLLQKSEFHCAQLSKKLYEKGNVLSALTLPDARNQIDHCLKKLQNLQDLTHDKLLKTVKIELIKLLKPELYDQEYLQLYISIESKKHISFNKNSF